MSEDELTRKLAAVLTKHTRDAVAAPSPLGNVTINVHGGIHFNISTPRQPAVPKARHIGKYSKNSLLQDIHRLAARYFHPSAWHAVLRDKFGTNDLTVMTVDELHEVRRWSERFHQDYIRTDR